MRYASHQGLRDAVLSALARDRSVRTGEFAGEFVGERGNSSVFGTARSANGGFMVMMVLAERLRVRCGDFRDEIAALGSASGESAVRSDFGAPPRETRGALANFPSIGVI